MLSRRQSQQTRDAILKEFHDQKQFSHIGTKSGLSKMIWSFGDNVKTPNGNDNASSLDKLSLLSVDELRLDTIHRGKFVTGKLIVDPNLAASVQTLLEDEFGSIVRVSVYNAIPSSVPQRDHLAYCHQRFPKGHYLTIKEPFFKIRLDGTSGIRVETLDDIIVSEHPMKGKKTAAEWKHEGNVAFKNKEFTLALQYYKMGLSVLNTDKVLTKLLTNISLCSFKALDHHRALMFALVASVIDETSDKACFRIALSLEVLQHPREANAFLKLMSAVASNDSSVAIRRLVTTHGAAALQPMNQIELAKSISSLLVGESWPSTCTTLLNIDVQATLTDAGRLKLEGDAMFREGQHSEASSKYLQSLAYFTAQAAECSPAILLSNITQCHLNLDNVPWAAMTAMTAISLDGSHVKSHHRLCESLIRLEMFDCALGSCDYAMQLFPNDVSFSAVRTRIVSAKQLSLAKEPAQAKNKAAADKMKSEKVLTEKSKYQQEKAESSTLEMIALQNILLSMPGIDKKELNDYFGVSSMVEERVAPFHLEVLKGVGLPPECDMDRCRACLYHAYELARALPMHEVHLIMPETIESLDSPERFKEIMQRFNENDAKKLIAFLSTAQIGDIRLDRTLRTYDCSILQSMSNATNRPEALTWGTVHVAIGFVDFGLLFHCSLIGHPSNGPLQWFGYEASAYCVAKSKVVAQMMLMGASVDSVLQVSYSSGWSRETKQQFREAIAALLSVHATIEPEIAAYFYHWQTHDVSLATSVNMWMDGQANGGSFIANYKQKMDRVALAKYFLTGQLLQCDTGSVVMYANPHKNEHIAFGSSFLHSIPNKEALFSRNKSIVTAAIELLQSKIRVTIEHVHSKRIVIEVRCGAVSLSEPRRVREIHQLRAYTMSWSNVCDYFHIVDFHRLARACSAPEDTIHFAYTMNWVFDVYGAQVLDVQLLGGSAPSDIERLKSIIEASKSTVAQMYKFMNIESYMHAPPLDNAKNICGYCLAAAHQQRYGDKFFELSTCHGQFPKAKVATLEFSSYNVLNRSHNNINFTFSYDPMITFNGIVV